MYQNSLGWDGSATHYRGPLDNGRLHELNSTDTAAKKSKVAAVQQKSAVATYICYESKKVCKAAGQLLIGNNWLIRSDSKLKTLQ